MLLLEVKLVSSPLVGRHRHSSIILIAHDASGLPSFLCATTPSATNPQERLARRTGEAIHCPTLLVCGAESDLLSHETALGMSHRGPRAELLESPGVGHAPMFIDAELVAPVREFLLAGK